MHASLLSDHAFNQLFRQKTKVCTEPWIMEGEKAERRMEVRHRGVQWQEVSLAQIFLLWQTAKSLLRSSHWREANRCRRRLSRKIYSVHSHLFTRTQRHRQTASTWNLTGGKECAHAHTAQTVLWKNESIKIFPGHLPLQCIKCGEFFLHRVRWHASQTQGSRASESEGNCDIHIQGACVFYLPCSCWPYFSSEDVWCWSQDESRGKVKREKLGKKKWYWVKGERRRDGDK